MKRTLGPLLLLLLLAPALGELLSSSMPPAEFFSPFVVFVIVLYGGGAILVRELTVRFGKGWPTLLILGAAYGIVEEGLMCKSFFDPHWPDLGQLGWYGRWAGVNWVWSLSLTAYHAVFSIAIPIVLVGLIFPRRRQRPWAPKWLLIVLAALLAADVAFGAAFFGADEAAGRGPYRPPPVGYAVCLLLVAALVVVALRLPARGAPAGPATRPPARLVWFLLTGFAATVLFFFIIWGVPHIVVGGLRLHPLGAMALLAAAAGLVGWWVRRLGRRGAGWTDGRRHALVAGAHGFFILLSPLVEMDPNRTDNPAGMGAVGLATLLLHLALAWGIRRRQRVRPAAADTCPSGAQGRELPLRVRDGREPEPPREEPPMTARELLLHETKLAYQSDEMALLSGVLPWKWQPPGPPVPDPARNLTDQAARRKPDCWHQSILDILKHVAKCKMGYMTQAFGPPAKPPGEPGETLESVLAYLEAAQGYLLACLEGLDEADLARPVQTDFHGESAANLFWVLAQHDVAHGSQIDVIRESLGV